MDRMPVARVRREFSETVNLVAYHGRRVVLQRNGKDLAALVSMADLAAIEPEAAAPKKGAARKAQGLFRLLAPGRDLVGELLRERREEVRREARK